MIHLSYKCKKIFKNPLNIVPIVILLIFIAGSLFINMRTNNFYYDLIEDELVYNIELRNQNMIEIENEIRSTKNEEILSKLNESLNWSIDELTTLNNSKNALNNKDWGNFYKNYYQYLTDIQQRYEGEEAIDQVGANGINYYQYQVDHRSNESPQFAKTNSMQFMVYISAKVFPLLGIFSILYILNLLYSEAFFDKIYIEGLFPIESKKLILNNINSGVVLSFSVLIIALILSFLFGGSISGFSGLNSGIPIYDSIKNDVFYVAIKDLLLEFAILQTLSFIVISQIVYYINITLKDLMRSLFISALAIIAPMMLVGKIVPLNAVAKYLPTTYFKSFDVIAGTISQQTNSSVTFGMGIIVLAISTIVLFSLTLRKQNKL